MWNWSFLPDTIPRDFTLNRYAVLILEYMEVKRHLTLVQSLLIWPTGWNWKPGEYTMCPEERNMANTSQGTQLPALIRLYAAK